MALTTNGRNLRTLGIWLASICLIAVLLLVPVASAQARASIPRDDPSNLGAPTDTRCYSLSCSLGCGQIEGARTPGLKASPPSVESSTSGHATRNRADGLALSQRSSDVSSAIDPGSSDHKQDDGCERVAQQLERDKEALRRQQKTNEMGLNELDEWTRANQEAEKQALGAGVKLLLQTFALDADAQAHSARSFKGWLTRYEKEITERGVPFEALQANIERAYSGYVNASIAARADHLINEALDARELWDLLRSELGPVADKKAASDLAVREALENPVLKALIDKDQPGGAFAKSLLSMAARSKDLEKIIGPQVELATFVGDYGYAATKWTASRNRILQQAGLADKELEAVDSLKGQIECTVRKLKQCQAGAAIENCRPKPPAAAWLAQRNAELGRELEEAIRQQTQAAAALTQAQAALTLSRDYKDTAADQVARQAVETALRAKSMADRRVMEFELVLKRVADALLWSFSTDQPVAVPALLRGEVMRSVEGGWQPLNPADPLRAGETVRTGRDGRVQVYFQDGSRIEIGPDSSFSYEKQTLEGTIYRLLKGTIRSHPPMGGLRGENIQYRMPTAVAAVRGTEFELRIDEQDYSHLVPYSGKVELSVEKGMDSRNVDRWWEKRSPVASSTPVPKGKLLRIDSLQGDVRIEDSATVSRAAGLGDTLIKGQRIVTGTDGLVQFTLAGGYRASLSASSRIEATAQGSSETPVFVLWAGLMHAARDASQSVPEPDRPMFMTPNSVAVVQNAEFQVAVLENGLSDYLPFIGSIDVTARSERLDLQKIKPWWEQPW